MARPRKFDEGVVLTAARDSFWRTGYEGTSISDLTEATGLSQPTVSHHLKILTAAGILRREQRGTWAWFSIVPGRLRELAAVFA